MSRMIHQKPAARAAAILLALAVALAAFLAAPASAHAEADDGTPIVVSLGDSYSSGEGNEPFYSQDSDDKYSIEDWYAHRSTLSWAGRLQVNGVTLSDIKDEGWYFYATSGAVAANIYESVQLKTLKESLLSSSYDAPVEVQLTSSSKAVSASSSSTADVDYVTLTIGGNDMNFSGIVTTVTVGNGFINRDYLTDALNEAWYDYNGTILFSSSSNASELAASESGDAYSRIISAYLSIRSYYINAAIIVAGYPTLLDDTKYATVLESFADLDISESLSELKSALAQEVIGYSDYEAILINQSVRLFNLYIQQMILDSGLSNIYYASVEEYFDGHEVGTDDPYLYGLLRRQSEDINYSPISSYSFHPNTADGDTGQSVLSEDDVNSGVTAYAWAVQQVINELEQSERDIVMVLDTSSSMGGDPISYTKEAASGFVEVVFENDARTALVTFSDDSEELLGLTSSENALKSAIEDISASGQTNIEAGLASAASLLEGSTAEKKYIVLMSDGLPNRGLEGDELIAYAESIRDPDGDGTDEVTIFVLGFNEEYEAQELLRQIASDGCYIAVEDSGDIEGFFTDMASSINGVKFTYIQIACPVDVTVTYDGETLTSAGDDPVTRTSFGTLTFEEVDEDGDGVAESDSTIKVLRLREGPSYTITIEGTDDGTMDYTIAFVDDTGAYSDFRTFLDIDIEEGTVITTSAEESTATVLEVDEDGDGTTDLWYRAEANSEGARVDSSFAVRAVVVGYLAVVAVAAVLVVRHGLRRLAARKR